MFNVVGLAGVPNKLDKPISVVMFPAAGFCAKAAAPAANIAKDKISFFIIFKLN
jgi:hypothetical protein